MDKNLSYAVVGLLVGVILTLTIQSFSNQQGEGWAGMMGGKNITSRSAMHGSMQGMMQGLENKTGDDFDRVFLSEMIVHHLGAVEMAEAALENAQHEEIKQLAREIISAQEKEINQMKLWQKEWYNK